MPLITMGRNRTYKKRKGIAEKFKSKALNISPDLSIYKPSTKVTVKHTYNGFQNVGFVCYFLDSVRTYALIRLLV